MIPEQEERVFVADYQMRLPTEETIKERLEELADSAGQDEESVSSAPRRPNSLNTSETVSIWWHSSQHRRDE